jgi:hypothetical protein
MYVQWDPEDGSEKQSWQFEPGDVGRKAAIQIEAHYDGSWDQWLQGLMLGKILARTVLLWYMLIQVHPKLRFDDVPDFRVRQLTVEMGSKEIHDLWTRAKRIKMSDDQREAFESQIVEDMRDALVREGKDANNVYIDENGILRTGAAPLPKAASRAKSTSSGSMSAITSG